MANSFISTNTGSYVALEVATLAAEAVLRLLRSVAPGFSDLADQVKRAVTSARLNLAEASGYSGRQRQHHNRVALGSTKEAQSALRLLMAAGAVPASEASDCLALLDRSAALCWRVVHPRR